MWVYKLVYRIFFTSITFLFTFNVLASNSQLCDKVLIANKSGLPWELDNDPYLSKDMDKPSVRIKELYTDSAGDEFFILIRPHRQPWYSSHSGKLRFDPAGDPRWPMRVFGPHLSQYFGFYFHTNSLQVPTPTTFNKRIKIFNQWLLKNRPNVKPIDVQFYWQKEQQITDYLQKLACDLSHPVADSLCTHTLHDISYHYSSIILTPEILYFLRLKAEAQLKFRALLAKEIGNNEKQQAAVKHWLQDVFRINVSEMDSMLSRGNINMSTDAKSKENYIKYFIEAFNGSWTAYPLDAEDYSIPVFGLSVIDILENTIQYYLEIFLDYQGTHPQIKKIKVPSHLNDRLNLGHQNFNYSLFQIKVRQVLQRLRSENPHLNHRFVSSKEDAENIYNKLIERRKSLVNAAKELLKKEFPSAQ